MTDTAPPSNRQGSGAELAAQLRQAAAHREKTRDLRPLLRLWPYVLERRADAGLMVLFLAIASAATFALTFVSRQLVDQGFSAQRAAAINGWFFAIAAVVIILAIGTALRYLFITRLGERIVASLREDVFAHILRLDPGFFTSIRTGEVVSRLTTDIQIIENLTSSAVSIALRNAVSFVVGLILMMVLSPKLTVMVLGLIPLVLVPIIVLGRQVGRLTRKAQDSFAEAVGNATETLEALETVQAFVREDYAATRFSQSVEAAFAQSMRRMTMRALMTALVIALGAGGVCCVLWLGARDVMHGDMTNGVMIQYVMIAVLVAGSVANLNETWGDLQKAAGAMSRIDELLRAQPGITAPPVPEPLPLGGGHIRFDEVSFAYPSRPDQVVLDRFSLEIRPGETVALVGPSGAGKSTVFKLLLRFYEPTGGLVWLDGVDIRRADPKILRDRMALVAQDSALFSGTAADNIRFGREGATQADIESAARKAQAHGFISALSGGYDHALGERARTLSGGQKQRLAIARALVREAPVLLLDEATSALDAENERLVQQALTEVMAERTTLVIAHRLATVLKADRIIVMDQGRVVESGTHEELVERGGLYARLAQLQFNA